MTGKKFPSYYVLNPMIRFHTDITPQLFDTRGNKEGRPVGVIEPDMTVRVEDMIGDWMQIQHEDNLAWVKYKDGTFDILVPALKNKRGFWKDLQAWSKPKLYRVSDTLPEYAEIKVRQLPLKDSIVCGSLLPGMMVQCWAINGGWLQIRYLNYASVWVLQSVIDKELLIEVPVSFQKYSSNKIITSPMMLSRARFEAIMLTHEVLLEDIVEDDDDDNQSDY